MVAVDARSKLTSPVSVQDRADAQALVALSETAPQQVPLQELIERYLNHARYEQRLAEHTLRIYAHELSRFQGLLNQAHQGIEVVDAAWIRNAMARLHAQGLSPRSLALTLSSWRNFFTHWVRLRVLVHHPVLDVRPPKAAKRVPKALSVDEAVALAQYQDPQADPWTRARDHAVIELLYGCGLRISELLGLDVEASAVAAGWVDGVAREVHVRGKGDKSRSVPLGGPAHEATQAWLRVRTQGLDRAPQSPALFLGRQGQRLSGSVLRASLKRWALGAGLNTSVHPHMLRHSFASHILQSSGDLLGVQELLGHASISATQVYTQLDFQHLAKIYDATHPRAKRKT